jgi:hypothetical protein
MGRSFRSVFSVIFLVAFVGLAAFAWTQHQELRRSRLELQSLQAKPQRTQAAPAEPAPISPDLQGEIERLRADNKDLLRLRAEVQRLRERVGETGIAGGTTNEAAPIPGSAGELERLRADNRDLLRLRNEIRQLREQQGEIEVLRAANARFLQALQENSLSNMMTSVNDVRKQGSLLGVQIIAAAPTGQAYRGAVVGGFMPDSPVQSDLKPGDIIIGVDGRPVESGAQLQVEMLTKKPGETVTLDVVRNGQTVRVPVQTRAWPQ